MSQIGLRILKINNHLKTLYISPYWCFTTVFGRFWYLRLTLGASCDSKLLCTSGWCCLSKQHQCVAPTWRKLSQTFGHELSWMKNLTTGLYRVIFFGEDEVVVFTTVWWFGIREYKLGDLFSHTSSSQKITLNSRHLDFRKSTKTNFLTPNWRMTGRLFNQPQTLNFNQPFHVFFFQKIGGDPGETFTHLFFGVVFKQIRVYGCFQK